LKKRNKARPGNPFKKPSRAAERGPAAVDAVDLVAEVEEPRPLYGDPLPMVDEGFAPPLVRVEPGHRVRDSSLDFKGMPAGEGVHAIHPYPAMFHPRLVRRLLQEFSGEGDLVVDPFTGSGVAGVESGVTGRRFKGWDINPLAIMIAQVRSSPIRRTEISAGLSEIRDRYRAIRADLPQFANIDFWFSTESAESISKLLASIGSVRSDPLRAFFRVALSETIRAVSRTKPHEFKLVRREKPNHMYAGTVFRAIALRNMNALVTYYAFNEIKEPPQFQLLNTLTEDIPLEDNNVSLLLTSPPYGDSQTTVAYGQFSRLSLQWLGLPHNVDKQSLGAAPAFLEKDLPSLSLYASLGRIAEVDDKRAMQVYAFYRDLFACLRKIVPKVKRGGHLILVVGNRTVRGVRLPTDSIVAEMMEALGCPHLGTRIREIGNKRMPSANSPSNVPGEKAPTMKHEHIVLCQKA
jgi:hypothetical protein